MPSVHCLRRNSDAVNLWTVRKCPKQYHASTRSHSSRYGLYILWYNGIIGEPLWLNWVPICTPSITVEINQRLEDVINTFRFSSRGSPYTLRYAYHRQHCGLASSCMLRIPLSVGRSIDRHAAVDCVLKSHKSTALVDFVNSTGRRTQNTDCSLLIVVAVWCMGRRKHLADSGFSQLRRERRFGKLFRNQANDS
jgi:hypothetical protein